jgi:hypothetical protein
VPLGKSGMRRRNRYLFAHQDRNAGLGDGTAVC